jgi:hypothetical protein
MRTLRSPRGILGVSFRGLPVGVLYFHGEIMNGHFLVLCASEDSADESPQVVKVHLVQRTRRKPPQRSLELTHRRKHLENPQFRGTLSLAIPLLTIVGTRKLRLFFCKIREEVMSSDTVSL